MIEVPTIRASRVSTCEQRINRTTEFDYQKNRRIRGIYPFRFLFLFFFLSFFFSFLKNSMDHTPLFDIFAITDKCVSEPTWHLFSVIINPIIKWMCPLLNVLVPGGKDETKEK